MKKNLEMRICNPQFGTIRKVLKVSSPSDWGSSKNAVVGLQINYGERSIEVQYLKGSMPKARNLFWALLADEDIRGLILEYQKLGDRMLHKLWSRKGASGCEDVFITEAERKGGFAATWTRRLCHISGYGRLNEGFGDSNSRMRIGDFVELCSFLGLTQEMEVEVLRKKAGVEYLPVKRREDLNDFVTSVTKIL